MESEMSDRFSVSELNRLTTLAREIRKLHDSTESLGRIARDKCNEAVAEALLLGHALAEAKEIVGHGGWLNWLKENCPKLSHTTAWRFMRLANYSRGNDLENSAGLKLAYIAAGIIQESKRTATAQEIQPKQNTTIDASQPNISLVQYLKHPGPEQTQPETPQDQTENSNISLVQYFEHPAGSEQGQPKTIPSAPENTDHFFFPPAPATIAQSELMESDPIDAIQRNVQLLVNAIAMLTDDLKPRAMAALEPLAAFRSEFSLYQWEEKK